MNLSPAWQPVTKPNRACTFTKQELILCALRSHETKRTLDRFLRIERRKNSVGCEHALSHEQPRQLMSVANATRKPHVQTARNRHRPFAECQNNHARQLWQMGQLLE